MIDLNRFVPKNSDLTLNEAVFINDSGEITGFGTLPSGDQHVFLLVPCQGNEVGCEEAQVQPALVAEVSAAVASQAKLSPAEMMPRFRSLRWAAIVATGCRNPHRTSVLESRCNRARHNECDLGRRHEKISGSPNHNLQLVPSQRLRGRRERPACSSSHSFLRSPLRRRPSQEPHSRSWNALDASSNVATSYSGTVHFTSTDGQAGGCQPTRR